VGREQPVCGCGAVSLVLVSLGLSAELRSKQRLDVGEALFDRAATSTLPSLRANPSASSSEKTSLPT